MSSFIAFGQRTKIFDRNSFWVIWDVGGWRWAWPILIKLSTLLIVIIGMTCAKFDNFWSANKIFLTEIHFGLYGRWAWPIFMKLQIFLNLDKRNITAKFHDPTMPPSNFVPKMYGLATLCFVPKFYACLICPALPLNN